MSIKKTSSSEKSSAASTAEAPPPCLVVAIGASAGGQEALEQLFTAMPTDCGVAFVVVMHLPASGPSFLAEMLGRYTTMEVVTAEDEMPLAPDRIHVIPAGRGLTVSGDRLLLHLADPAEPLRAHHPIDRLFHSLAEARGGNVIAVVLSGFGTDGTVGARAIRAAGGTVIAQDPASAVSPAMPRSVIAAGAASLVLPAEAIPVKLAEIARGVCSLAAQACHPATMEDDLHAIFTVVKAVTGHDFSSYKTSTVIRRIERRMAVNDAAGIGKYIALLRKNHQEAHALCQDILIGVTGFFRDPEAFDTLRREVIPRLFADRDPDDPVRIWHTCCATGEEAYSMAMLIREYLDEHRLAARAQIFATDIDEVAVAQARAGLYDDAAVSDVGEERLKAFFTGGDGHWQVAKALREMVVFAHHSLIKDPPFSRLDFLACRNFLIYLNPDMQKRLITLFHQVLKPGGVLFLGSAESVGHRSELFTTLDKKWKIFIRREGAHRVENPFPLATSIRLPGKQRPARPAEIREPSPDAMADRFLVERYAPPGVVINEKYEVIHTSSRTGRFLEVPVGEQSRDILKMAREELRPALRAAIYKGFAEQGEVNFRGVKVNDGDGTTVNILVKPLGASPSGGKLLMVVFEPAASSAAPSLPAGEEEASEGETSREQLIRQLEEQLHITHEQLQATTEQLESSNEGFLSASEELMSINEEFQSANEELQSTNEELETSKEELQALNEELVTVNAELQGKVEELNQANSNMENLLATSGIATIFLDRRLDLKGFTPAAATLFNLIPADSGRPFRHFAGKIDWPTFTRDAETVLAGQPFAEREVTTLDSDRCYLKRLFPYRTPAGVIDGLVVTLIDITERKRMIDELRKNEERYRGLVETAPIAIFINRDNRIEYANRAALELFGADGAAVIGRTPYDFVHPDFHAAMTERIKTLLRGGGVPLTETSVLRPDGSERQVEVAAVTFVDRQGVAIQVMMHDITERKRAEAEAAESRTKLEAALASMNDALFITDAEARFVEFNDAFATYLRFRSKDECITSFAEYSDILEVFQANGEPSPTEQWAVPRALRGESATNAEYTLRRKDTGETWTGSYSFAPIRDRDGVIVGSIVTCRDITEIKRAEAELQRTRDEWELTFNSVPDLIAIIDHHHRVVRVNRAMAEQLGRTPEECVGLRCYEAIHGSDLPPGFCPHVRTLTDGGEHREEVYEESLGGDYLVSTTPLLDHAGLMIGSVHVARNISERKQAEEALRESEERFRTLADAIPQLCWMANADGWITWYNQRWYEYTGTGPEQMEGWGWQSVHDPQVLPQVVEQWQDSIATGKPFDMIFPLLGADGVFRPFLTRVMPLRDREGTVVRWFGTNTDISEQRKAEAALQLAKEAAESGTRTKSRFLANMSHELRTPMTGVLGMLDLVLSGNLEAEQREFISAAHTSAGSLLRILNDILDLTKIEAGKLSIDPKPFSIRECVKNAANILFPAAKNKKITLTFTVADAVPDTLIGDQTRLSQVLTNLTGNAIKFTEVGTVAINVSTGDSTDGGGREVIFAITDTGIGIPEDKKNLLFREFSQIDDSHSRIHGGTGLGLAISKEIVERMGGKITFKSEEGKGSTFFCYIPFAEAEPERDTAPTPQKTAPTAATPGSGAQASPRLLLAEDDQTIRKMLGVMLRRTNYEIDLAENGQKVVEMWEGGEYDLILMDVQMPYMNGFEATGAIRGKERSRGGHIPIIAMTAHALKEDEERCLAAGMDAYISKPIDFNACRELIRETLAKAESEEGAV
ncbi:PAS domain-containing protein [Geobacter sp. AOG2]|uniref:PAS domain-containing protein n=1 Tax=Geobacter sp. AOG2 TaxID=1566347 RepID=UPI001CC5A22B|nr:PAS domain-containing protein [Geobacter sp. AOG2]GFE62850.1 protein-glutamate methylesterase [Geobacter sp. AOG2]